MWKILMTCLVLLPLQVIAQLYYPVKHLKGDADVNMVKVTVNNINSATSGGGSCGINDYWIGKDGPGGFSFAFSRRVEKIRLRIEAINTNEIVQVIINDRPYPISKSDLQELISTCNGILLPVIEDGILVGNGCSNAIIDIEPLGGIERLAVMQLRGHSGSVFDLAIVEESNISNLESTSSLTPKHIPSDELFSLMPNPATNIAVITLLAKSYGTAMIKITDMLGRVLYDTKVECLAGERHEVSLNIDSWTPGSYVVDIVLNNQEYRKKLIKL